MESWNNFLTYKHTHSQHKIHGHRINSYSKNHLTHYNHTTIDHSKAQA
jgi:hypothetical protein